MSVTGFLSPLSYSNFWLCKRQNKFPKQITNAWICHFDGESTPQKDAPPSQQHIEVMMKNLAFVSLGYFWLICRFGVGQVWD